MNATLPQITAREAANLTTKLGRAAEVAPADIAWECGELTSDIINYRNGHLVLTGWMIPR